MAAFAAKGSWLDGDVKEMLEESWVQSEYPGRLASRDPEGSDLVAASFCRLKGIACAQH